MTSVGGGDGQENALHGLRAVGVALLLVLSCALESHNTSDIDGKHARKFTFALSVINSKQAPLDHEVRGGC